MSKLSLRAPRVILCIFAGYLALSISSVHAAIITGTVDFGGQAGTGPGVGTVSVPITITPNPNNDLLANGGPSDNNISVPIKRFDANGFIDIVFNIANSAGTTEYKVFESVDNNTLLPWSSYTMQLGFGFGGAFTPSALLDGLDFDAPTFDTPPTSTAFSTVTPINEDTLFFSSGLHASGAQTYQFRIDVADLPLGVTSFTLRQTPTAIPEPSTYLMLSAAGMALFVFRRRR